MPLRPGQAIWLWKQGAQAALLVGSPHPHSLGARHGAWIVVILVPLLVLMFLAVARHYRIVREQVGGLSVQEMADLQTIVLAPIAQLDRVAWRSLVYAETLAPECVIAIHVAAGAEDEERFRADWIAWLTRQNAGKDDQSGAAVPVPRLIVIESPYRSLIAPLVSYAAAVRMANPGSVVTVVLPEFVPAHWWEHLLHNQTALRLKLALFTQRDIAVANLPYHLSR